MEIEWQVEIEAFLVFIGHPNLLFVAKTVWTKKYFLFRFKIEIWEGYENVPVTICIKSSIFRLVRTFHILSTHWWIFVIFFIILYCTWINLSFLLRYLCLYNLNWSALYTLSTYLIFFFILRKWIFELEESLQRGKHTSTNRSTQRTKRKRKISVFMLFINIYQSYFLSALISIQPNILKQIFVLVQLSPLISFQIF